MSKSQPARENPKTRSEDRAVPRVGRTPAEKPPKGEGEDEATTEDFRREGMGVSAKE